MTTTEKTQGQIRAFLWDYKKEIELDLSGVQICFNLDGQKVEWGNLRMLTVLKELLESGKDILVLLYNDAYFLSLPLGVLNDEVNLVNATLDRAFNHDFAEISPSEDATDDVDLIYIVIENYPCTVVIDSFTIEVTKDSISFVEEEEDENS